MNLFLWSDVFKSHYDTIFHSELVHNVDLKLVCDNQVWTADKNTKMPYVSAGYVGVASNSLRENQNYKKKNSSINNAFKFALNLNLNSSLNTNFVNLYIQPHFSIIFLRGPPAQKIKS